VYTATFVRDFMSLILGKKEVSGQAVQDTSSQQLQQGDAVETFQQLHLSSGKFNMINW